MKCKGSKIKWFYTMLHDYSYRYFVWWIMRLIHCNVFPGINIAFTKVLAIAKYVKMIDVVYVDDIFTLGYETFTKVIAIAK